MEQNRSRTADFLKGVALIAMVQVVLTEFFALPSIFNGNIGKISMFLGGAPVAPVFLAIMGYYIAHSHTTLSARVWRGLKLILLGFFVNIARNATNLYAIYSGISGQNPWDYVFGVDILIVAGLSVIAMAFFIRVFNGHVLLYLGLIVVFLVLRYVLPPVEKIYPTSHLMPFVYGNYAGAYFPFIPWFAYVLAGYSFFQFKHFFVADGFKRSSKVKIVLVIISGLLLLNPITLPFGFNVTIRPLLFAHHGILFFLFCINLLFWWMLSAHSIVLRVNNKITGYLEWTGKNVSLFYVFFMIIAGNLVSFQKQAGLLMLLILFIVLTAVTVLLVKVYEKAFVK